MDESFWSAFGNSSQIVAVNSSSVPPTASTSPSSQTVPAVTVAAVGLFIFVVGIGANSVVLAVLVRARRHFNSSVHTLIANQCAIDLFACVFGASTLVMMITHGYKYNGNAVLDGTISLLTWNGRGVMDPEA